ncbi:hypothetical protein JTB14_021603 [Gonioctena quinquepunctata]|nr:hypothetical protein JTB14_021603 [Gonioctena quinquepunctata]
MEKTVEEMMDFLYNSDEGILLDNDNDPQIEDNDQIKSVSEDAYLREVGENDISQNNETSNHSNLNRKQTIDNMTNIPYLKKSQLLLISAGDDWFIMLVGDDFLEMIVRDTNEYAVEVLSISTGKGEDHQENKSLEVMNYLLDSSVLLEVSGHPKDHNDMEDYCCKGCQQNGSAEKANMAKTRKETELSIQACLRRAKERKDVNSMKKF